MVEIGKRSINNIGRSFITLPLSGRILKKGDKHNGLFFVGIVPNKNNPNAPSLNCAVIIKQVDEKTRSKTSINDLLRD